MTTKLIISYDEQAKVYIAEAKDEFEGVILEDDSLLCLLKRVGVAIEGWVNNYGN